jgi:hypothetical protein
MSVRIFHYFWVFIAALALNLSVDASDAFVPKDIASLSSTHKFPKLHLPVESVPTPNDREVPDENELEDDFDSDLGPLVEKQTLFSLFGLVTVADCIAYSAFSIHSRSAVPLFVLYHSWKSFMA